MSAAKAPSSVLWIHHSLKIIDEKIGLSRIIVPPSPCGQKRLHASFRVSNPRLLLCTLQLTKLLPSRGKSYDGAAWLGGS